MITVGFFLLKRGFSFFFFFFDILFFFLRVFNFTAQTAIPIATTELWQIKLCLHQTCFLYPQTYLKHFFFFNSVVFKYEEMPHGFIVHVCLCSGRVWHQCRLVKQDPFCKKKKKRKKRKKSGSGVGGWGFPILGWWEIQIRSCSSFIQPCEKLVFVCPLF